ncbi:MAG: hypothetical protein SangKO_073300 [Sandaracinaceae bacterium]
MADVQSRVAPKAVLLAGSGERLTDALVEALERRRVAVDRAGHDELVGQAYVLAPDLVVLLGDAAADGGREAAAALAGKRATASIPVAVVREAGALEDRLDTFRHGVVAIVPRSASADEMAERIASIAREVPDRSGEVTRGGTEASVDELVALFAEQLRTGILSVAAGGDDVSAQVVLRADKPVEEMVGELVDRLRPLMKRAQGPLRYEFFESAAPHLAALDLDLEPEEGIEALSGVRIVLVEQRAHRADSLAQDLRAAGAQVVVADGAGVGLERAKRLDPQVVVIDGAGDDGWALGALRKLRRDVHLRWASLLVVREEQLWRRADGRPDLAALAGALGPLVQGEAEIAARAAREETFGVRMELVGPVRLLRALAGTGGGLRLTVSHPSVQVQLDLADGLVAGALAKDPGSANPRAQGPAALATFCALSSGRVTVERKEAPASTNIMAPVGDALAQADAEEALIRPSLPPSFPPGPAVQIPKAPAVPRTDSGDERVAEKLETLLARLQKILPEAEAMVSRAPPPAASAPPRPSSPRAQARVPAPPSAASPPSEPRRSGQALPAAASNPPSASMPPGAELPSAPLGAGSSGAGSSDAGSSGAGSSGAGSSGAGSSGAGSSGAASSGAGSPGAGSSGTAPWGTASSGAASSRTAPSETARSGLSGGELPGAALSGVGAPPAPTPRAAAPFPPVPPSEPLPSALAASPAPPIPSPPSPMSSPAEEAGLVTQRAPARPASLRDMDLHGADTQRPPPSAPRLTERGDESTARLGTPDAWKSDTELPMIARDAIPRRRGGAGRWIAIGVAGTLLLLVGAGAAAWLASSGERAAAAPPVETPRGPSSREAAPVSVAAAGPIEATEARDPEGAGEEGAAPPAEEEPAEPTAAPDTAVYGPLDDAPIEGSSDDFSLEALGIEEAPAPSSRRRRARTVRELIRTANILRNRHELGRAEELYRRVLSLEPDNTRATAGLTRVYMEREDAAQAILFAQRLVRLRPGFASNYVLLGDTLEQGRNPAAARRAWTRAVEIEPRWGPARARLARGPQ